MFLSFKVASPDVSSNAQVDFTATTLTLTYQDQTISLNLTNEIVPEESSKTTTAKKIEIKLKKRLENMNWMGVEKGGEAKLLATAVPGAAEVKPSYPTSSK